MRKPPQRANLINIRGEKPEPDIVTDADYLEAVTAQDAVLYAQGHERKVLGRLRTRLERGALDQGRLHYFDLERGIVRRRVRRSS